MSPDISIPDQILKLNIIVSDHTFFSLIFETLLFFFSNVYKVEKKSKQIFTNYSAVSHSPHFTHLAIPYPTGMIGQKLKIMEIGIYTNLLKCGYEKKNRKMPFLSIVVKN